MKFVLDLGFRTFFLDYRWLSFQVLTSYREAAGANKETYTGGLSYCLEAGVIHWHGTADDQGSPLNLRENQALNLADRDHLASWEPITDDKMGSLAIELGLMGNTHSRLLDEPAVSAVAVNPNGFVYRWHGGRNIYISDVGTLAASDNIFHDISPATRLWEQHTLSAALDNYIRYGEGQVILLERPWTDLPNSLAEWSSRLAPPVLDPRTKPESDFTGEAAVFVQRHFGVDVSSIDWKAANHARFVNAKYSPTEHFDSNKALRALRRTITSADKGRTRTSLPAARPHYRKGNIPKPPSAGPSH
ncbi:MAG: hypothetical protein JO281_02510 [Pseudonocardiales bacterium]|nr:hypothetical protein [Pseudonocardiales bacterium]